MIIVYVLRTWTAFHSYECLVWKQAQNILVWQSFSIFLSAFLPALNPPPHILYLPLYLYISLTLLVHILRNPLRPFLNFSICILVWSCTLVLVFSYYVIINHRSSIPVINNASTWSTKDAWKNPDVFLMSKMHRMQIWKKLTIRNPRSHCGQMIQYMEAWA